MTRKLEIEHFQRLPLLTTYERLTADYVKNERIKSTISRNENAVIVVWLRLGVRSSCSSFKTGSWLLFISLAIFLKMTQFHGSDVLRRLIEATQEHWWLIYSEINSTFHKKEGSIANPSDHSLTKFSKRIEGKTCTIVRNRLSGFKISDFLTPLTLPTASYS
jgi:hypothetical protein